MTQRVVYAEDVIREFNSDYGHVDSDTMFVKRMRALEMSERQIAGVIVILQTICTSCMDQPSGCKCGNDE